MEIKKGSKYYVKKEDYEKFFYYCSGYSVSSNTIGKFSNEKPQKIIAARDGAFAIEDDNSLCWAYPNRAINLLVLYFEFIQEEMEI